MAASDTTKPVLTSLSFSSIVDVTNGGQNLSFTAGATDVGLGVSQVYVSFSKSWQNQSGNQSYLLAYDSTDSFSDGYSSGQTFISTASGAGTYSIDNVIVYVSDPKLRWVISAG